MRRQLVVLFAAVSLLVALAFVVPLALLVSTTAEDRAIDAARSDVAAVTPVLAAGGTRAQIEAALGVTGSGRDGRMTVVTDQGWVVGGPEPVSARFTAALESGTSDIGDVDGGIEVVAAVATGPDMLSAVRVFVPDAALTEGRGRSWTALGIVAVVLVGISVFVADRLARSIVAPTQRLVGAARRLGEGELDARVEPEGPAELIELGAAFNSLGGRVSTMLDEERELVADLSHRLRTPLTRLRLRLDQVDDATLAEELQADIDDMTTVVSDLIEEARGRVAQVPETSDVVAVVIARSRYWSVLAEDQERAWDLRAPADPALVRVAPADLEAAVDALAENVFSHTDEGTAVRVAVSIAPDEVSIAVGDAGPGFSADAVEPGATGAQSTGLGLDIARRTAQEAGGALAVGRSELGGAEVVITLPLL